MRFVTVVAAVLFVSPCQASSVHPLRDAEEALGTSGLRFVTEIEYTAAPSVPFHLFLARDDDLTFELIEKFPTFGRLVPLNIPVWRTGNGTLRAAMLSSAAMGAIAGIPPKRAELAIYADKIKDVLKDKLGIHPDIIELRCECPAIESVTKLVRTEADRYEEFYEEYSEDFEAGLERRIEKAGFTLRAMDNLEERLAKTYDKEGVYDFYEIYTVYAPQLLPIVTRYPRTALVIPWTLYHYKRSGDPQVHLGFMDIVPVLQAMGVTDKNSLKKVRKVQLRLFGALSTGQNIE